MEPPTLPKALDPKAWDDEGVCSERPPCQIPYQMVLQTDSSDQQIQAKEVSMTRFGRCEVVFGGMITPSIGTTSKSTTCLRPFSKHWE
jgi:hypothetical protein